jgi:hypothetical protein
MKPSVESLESPTVLAAEAGVSEVLRMSLGFFHGLLAHPVAPAGRMARWMAVCLLWLGCALSALACVNEEVQVVDDPFSGRTRTFTVSLPSAGPPYYQGFQSVSVTEAGGKYVLALTVMSWGESSAVARMGDPAEFAVGPDVLALTSSGEAPPVANVFARMVYTQWRVPFALDAAMASRFAAAPLRAFKFRVGGQVVQVSLPAGQAQKFRDNMAILTSR